MDTIGLLINCQIIYLFNATTITKFILNPTKVNFLGTSPRYFSKSSLRFLLQSEDLQGLYAQPILSSDTQVPGINISKNKNNLTLIPCSRVLYGSRVI
jgi:hypothetical protein